MKKIPKQRVYIDYIGCERRKLDTQRILDFFLANGFYRTPSIELADFCILVTCGFRTMYEQISITKLNRIIRKKKPEAKIIISGCLPSINPTRLNELAEVTLIDPRNMEIFDTLIQPTVSITDIRDPNITIFDSEAKDPVKMETYSTPAHREYLEAKRGFKIRISEGCLGNCSYCVAKFATKKLASKPLEYILEQFHEGLNLGYHTFLFTGSDTGAYGQDLHLSIVDLFKGLFNIEGDYRLYFHDFGINWLIRYLNDLLPIFEQNRDHLGCFNFPIQSGSDSILKAMCRPYKANSVYETIRKLKSTLPEFKIGTHYIVGFPGENEEHFNATYQMIQELPFDFLVIFKYSDNPRAESSKLAGKIPRNVIDQRAIILQELFNNKTHLN